MIREIFSHKLRKTLKITMLLHTRKSRRNKAAQSNKKRYSRYDYTFFIGTTLDPFTCLCEDAEAVLFMFIQILQSFQILPADPR